MLKPDPATTKPQPVLMPPAASTPAQLASFRSEKAKRHAASPLTALSGNRASRHYRLNDTRRAANRVQVQQAINLESEAGADAAFDAARSGSQQVHDPPDSAVNRCLTYCCGLAFVCTAQGQIGRTNCRGGGRRYDRPLCSGSWSPQTPAVPSAAFRETSHSRIPSCTCSPALAAAQAATNGTPCAQCRNCCRANFLRPHPTQSGDRAERPACCWPLTADGICPAVRGAIQ